jgi:hypothetical protein
VRGVAMAVPAEPAIATDTKNRNEEIHGFSTVRVAPSGKG